MILAHNDYIQSIYDQCCSFKDCIKMQMTQVVENKYNKNKILQSVVTPCGLENQNLIPNSERILGILYKVKDTLCRGHVSSCPLACNLTSAPKPLDRLLKIQYGRISLKFQISSKF